MRRGAHYHAPALRPNLLLEHLRPVLAPVVVLVASAVIVWIGSLPDSLAGLTVLGPYFVLLLGAIIAVWFNRGRAFVALGSLFAAYAGYRIALEFGADSFTARAVFTALSVLVPLNVLIALLFPERGVVQHRNYRWLLLALAEVLLVAWVASAGRSSLSGIAWHGVLDHWLLRSPPAPIAGRIAFAAAVVAALARAWPRTGVEVRPIDAGLAGALVAFFIACEWARSPGVFPIFMSGAGIILLVSILQESHRLAFVDELTGLPGRRALEERLSGLGPVYTVAMVDVDHFKRFNDTYGHARGDETLQEVARAVLYEVRSTDTAYRYGGEEFAILARETDGKNGMVLAERLRRRIEEHFLAHGSPAPVTASFGVGLVPPGPPVPREMIATADSALYRAKEAGRNRVRGPETPAESSVNTCS